MSTDSPTFAPHPRLLVALALVLALILAACGGDDDDVTAGDDDGNADLPGEEPPDGDDPFGIDEWILVSATVDGGPLALLDSHPVTLRVDDAGGVGGTAACNNYFGDLTADGPTLFAGFGVTEMACDPPAAMDLEFAFLDALGRTTAAERDGDQLVLTAAEVELRFDRVVPPADAELEGTTWILDTIISGDAATSLLAGTSVQLELDGTELVAFDGCNTLGGGYELDGDVLRTGPMRATTRACAEGVTRQAGQFIAVVGGAPTLEIDGNHLTMSGPDGLGLRFTAG